MAAIKSAKKSALKNKKIIGELGIKHVIGIAVFLSMMVTLLLVTVAWKFYLEDRAYNKFLIQASEGSVMAYKAGRDIEAGTSLQGAIDMTPIPSYLNVENALGAGSNINELKASMDIKKNTIITENNCYDPKTQDVILMSSREVVLDYIETPGVVEGDYIDIRLKAYNDYNKETYRDEIVCAKKVVITKGEDGEIKLMLSEADILNINSAVIEAADINHTAEIYVTKYVDPANQVKALVNYSGKGINYTAEELLEAQSKLRGLQNPTQEEDTGSVIDAIQEYVAQ